VSPEYSNETQSSRDAECIRALRAEVERLKRERVDLIPFFQERDAFERLADATQAELNAERERHHATAQRLAGLRPEFPPMPNEGHGLPRYGLLWPPVGTFTGPLSVPMADGYWTPWHLADAEHHATAGRVERLTAALRAAFAYIDDACTADVMDRLAVARAILKETKP